MVLKFIRTNPVFVQFVNLYTAWRALILSMISALVLCIIYIYFLSIFAEYVAWGIIFLTQALLVAFCLGSLYMYTTYEDSSMKNGALIGGIVCGILAALFLLAICCGWRQLKAAIKIIDATADYLSATKRVFGVPLIYYVVMVAYIFFWLACFISAMSCGKITPKPDNSTAGHWTPFKKSITWDDRKEIGKIVNGMIAFLCFAIIWFVFFLSASSNYVIMVTAATFYFTCKPVNGVMENGSGEVSTGLRWAWVHNFGSLAFGSFIIAVIFTIRVIVYYLFKKLEKASGDNALIKCISCLVQCFLKCLQEIVEYINKAAYAFMALSG